MTRYHVRDSKGCVLWTGWRARALGVARDVARREGEALVTMLRKDQRGDTYRTVEKVFPDGMTETVVEEERI